MPRPTFVSNSVCCQNGETVLHAAVLSGDVVVVDQLVLAGANPDQVNMAGLTALDVAKDKNKEIKEKLRPVTNKTTDPRILARTQDVSRRYIKINALESLLPMLKQYLFQFNPR